MKDIATIRKTDTAYPPLLKEIPDAPEQFFLRGAISPLPALAVVGSRAMTAEGKRALTFLLSGCERAPMCIVSGLALGVDGLAHSLALKHHLATTAVLGSGVDDASIYPREHVGLACDILSTGGAVLSEYAPATPSYKSHFPERNRIIAGMSCATLVVEASSKSGALITAFLALEYNRDVAVIPHSLFHPNGEGVHRLLKRGAIPVTSPSDLLALVKLPTPAGTAVFVSAAEYTLCEKLKERGLFLDEICEQMDCSIASAMTQLSPLLQRTILIEQRDGRYALAAPFTSLCVGRG